jgi:DNA-binding SARP family transcriptional activator
LRWSLSKLRHLVDEASDCRLIADRETVQLDCSTLSVDWRHLRDVGSSDVRKRDTHSLELAAALSGEFMEGLDLSRCDDYQAWLLAMREDVRRWQGIILRELVSRPLDVETLLGFARHWSELDPYDALARTALIDLLERSSRRGEADQQRASGIRKLGEADMPIPASFREGHLSLRADTIEESLPQQQVRFCTASDGT